MSVSDNFERSAFIFKVKWVSFVIVEDQFTVSRGQDQRLVLA